jgi:hypothetical protein
MMMVSLKAAHIYIATPTASTILSCAVEQGGLQVENFHRALKQLTSMPDYPLCE